MRLGVFYLIYAALFRCSSEPFSFNYNPKHELLVCREMASVHENVAPVIHDLGVKTHDLLHPYAGKYMDATHDAWKRYSPALYKSSKQMHDTYRMHVVPGARALYKQAHAWSLPHQRTLHSYYKKHVYPYVKKMNKALNPYVRTYHKDVHPHVLKAGRSLFDAHDASSKYYVEKLHPRIKSNIYNAYKFGRHTAFPFAHHHYVTHAHPHVKKLHASVSAAVDQVLQKYGIKDGSLVNKVTDKVQDVYSQAGAKVSEAASAVDETLSKSGLKDGSVVNKVPEAAQNAYEQASEVIDQTLKDHGIREKTMGESVADAVQDAYEQVEEAVSM